MIKAPCLFYEIIISREMHNNWCISQSTTKKMAVYKHSDIILPIYAQHVNGLSWHFAPNANILYEYTKKHQKRSVFANLIVPITEKFFSTTLFYLFQHHLLQLQHMVHLGGKKSIFPIKPDAPYTSYAPFLSTASDSFKLEVPFFAYIFKSNLHQPIYKPEFVA